MGIDSRQARAREPIRHVSLLVGSGGELSLMSAIFHVPSGLEIGDARLSDWVRVETIEQAVEVAKAVRLKLVVADPAICASHETLIDARGKSVPINPVSTAIERILGRAFVQHSSSSHDATAVQLSQSRTYFVTKRTVDLGVSALALALLAIPVAVIYGIFLPRLRPLDVRATAGDDRQARRTVYPPLS